MVGVQEAAVLSTQLAQQGMPLSRWAGLMRQFDHVLRGQDHAVGRAASIGHLFVVGDDGAPPFVVELDSVAVGEPSAGDRRVIRVAVLQATRAAQRGANAVEKLVLSGVERELLQPPEGDSAVELALRGWTLAVSKAASSATPAHALAISMTQQALMHLGVWHFVRGVEERSCLERVMRLWNPLERVGADKVSSWLRTILEAAKGVSGSRWVSPIAWWHS